MKELVRGRRAGQVCRMQVNGETIALSALQLRTLRELVEHFRIDPRLVAAQRNGEIAPRESWDRILLEEEDVVELIRFVGGG